METIRFTEYYLCDAIRLASHFAEKYGGSISEGIGDSSLFPNPPKTGAFSSQDVRFARVDGGSQSFGVAFVSEDEPPIGERKYRNKSLYRVLVGEEIRRFRTERGMSLKEVADKSGFREHSLERLEEGRFDFDIAQLGVVLDALGGKVRIE